MRLFLLLLIALLPYTSHATPKWHITKQTLTFTATQNNVPVTGSFNTLHTELYFAPEALDQSSVTSTIDINSLHTDYQEVGQTLRTEPWFHSDFFPQATYQSTQFSKLVDNHYHVDGTLTIKGISHPVPLSFTLDHYDNTSAKATGTATLKRTDFTIGTGQWQATSNVKDTVTLTFTIEAKRE